MDQTEPTSNQQEISVLWYYLSNKYSYMYPRDWYLREAHWLNQIESFQEQPVDCPGRDARTNNSLTRISQCNESFQLCDSLPISFFVPKDLDDVTLIHKMSPNIRDHRVPIISYCCPIKCIRNFIIRCASFDCQSDISKILAEEIVQPFKLMDLTMLAPNLKSVELAHRKLLNVYRVTKEPGSKFISRSGRWLSIVSQTIKLAKTTARIVLTEASVILIDKDDKHWNCVISSLAQILLDPHTRTLDGFESLISKEWIYLCGHNSRGLDNCNNVSTLFILFLDCVCQMYSQNPRKFEFTSHYLMYLYDAHDRYIHGSLPSLPSLDYKVDMFNPFYDDNEGIRFTGMGGVSPSPVVMEVQDHIASIKLWSSPYLTESPFPHICPEEYIYSCVLQQQQQQPQRPNFRSQSHQNSSALINRVREYLKREKSSAQR